MSKDSQSRSNCTFKSSSWLFPLNACKQGRSRLSACCLACFLLYRAAISLEPTVAIYYGNRAAASFMLGKYKEALADSLTSIKLDASYARGYQRAAKAYLTLGKFAEVSDCRAEGVHHFCYMYKSYVGQVRRISNECH